MLFCGRSAAYLLSAFCLGHRHIIYVATPTATPTASVVGVSYAEKVSAARIK